MGKPNVLFVSSNYIRMANIVIHALTVKEYVQCAGSKCSTPSSTSKAMYNIFDALANPIRSP
ncbi:cysteine-rich pdz-binding protein [Phtheirospermum japonicum]|uniref:Cysteine-rich pdz-binding protein n=1 Tax=Phtheirospermum japonicum TaxID=374723 RepID=A0A830D648_9LAMI|nr:cysteine-rich pdz-binding protein [Phtheirospermum japonicum]